ncbi:hypothetical protein B0H17DRAFT_1111085, partial [Mycena rosella]
MWRCEYMQLAAVKNFTEVADFEVSPGFLISIIKNSGLAEDDADDEAAFEPVTYLVEPLRSTSVVRKFSGTLGATQDTDKPALTMLSFSHFMLDVAACAISMVDLHGSMHVEPGAIRRLTLFDPMSHTITEDSGVGDFGATVFKTRLRRISVVCTATVWVRRRLRFESYPGPAEEGGDCL